VDRKVIVIEAMAKYVQRELRADLILYMSHAIDTHE
jgi:hypothetical protein